LGGVLSPHAHLFVAEYDSSGNQIWVKGAGDSAFSTISSIAHNSAGSIYVSGLFSEVLLKLDTSTLTIPASSYYYPYSFAAKIPALSESVPSIERGADILINPNPAHSTLTVSSQEKITSIAICNLVGQTVRSERPAAEKADINIADLPAGIYLVRINDAVVRKFVKE
jgi:hypothetical protein